MRYCCLCELLANKSDLVGCELGVANGDNAAGMFEKLRIKHLYLVDPYLPYYDSTQQSDELLQRPFETAKQEAEELLKGKDVTWIDKQSWDAVGQFEDNSLDFVYIDASHQYESVSMDIRQWLPKVKVGGILAGHDYSIKDVARAVNKYSGGQPHERDTNEWWCQKV